ncbi:hypothetical protein Bca4012_017015 [Brassica carinata]
MDRVLSLIITIILALSLTGRCSHVYSRSDFPEGFAFGSGASSYQVRYFGSYSGSASVLINREFECRKEKTKKKCLMRSDSGKVLLLKTGESRASGILTFTLVIIRGPVNAKGLQFYKNFIQELVTHGVNLKSKLTTGIEPHVTLYHYDHPQALEDDYGGWLNPTIIKDFTAYADVCFREFGNHVKFWTTINEANIFTIGGYNDGITAPGRCSRNCISGNSSSEPYIVGHNLLLAHASASRLYRQKYKGGSVGFGLFAIGFSPTTSSKDDEIATQRARDFYLGWMLGPLVFGEYPYVMRRTVGSRLPHFSEEESELVKGSSDFVGITHYTAATVTNIIPYYSGDPDFYSDTSITLTYLCNDSSTGLLLDTCDDTPWAMEGVLEYIKQSYENPPVYILENGKSIKGDFQLQEKDTPRIEYLHVYIGAVLKAVRNGSDTRGYFVWSLMDLYELLDGYGSTFGLYYVNFSDSHRKRSPKHSAHWYSAFLKGDTTFLGSQGIAQLQINFSSSSL